MNDESIALIFETMKSGVHCALISHPDELSIGTLPAIVGILGDKVNKFFKISSQFVLITRSFLKLKGSVTFLFFF